VVFRISDLGQVVADKTTIALLRVGYYHLLTSDYTTEKNTSWSTSDKALKDEVISHMAGY